jgi:hypothetical protein
MQFEVVTKIEGEVTLTEHVSGIGIVREIRAPDRIQRSTFQIVIEPPPKRELTVDDLPTNPDLPTLDRLGLIRYFRIFPALKRHASPLIGKQILEVGPRDASFLEAMRNHGLMVDGLEKNPLFAQGAQERGFRVLEGDILNPPRQLLMGNGFDVTMSRLVLDIVQEGEGDLADQSFLGLKPVLGTVKRALHNLAVLTKPGGISLHEVQNDWGLTNQDFIDAGFKILEGSAEERFVVLRRKSSISSLDDKLVNFGLPDEAA